jgi:transcription initiation factor TFIID subunit 7
MEPGSSRRVTLSFNKNGISKSGDEFGRKTSFLGEYDRDLDEHPNEPLSFEEQFVLRVPDSVAGKLREMVKGKGKGLEGVEFKFLGESRPCGHIPSPHADV